MSDRYAFVDESYIVATRHYLLAAVVVREDVLDDVRASVRAVRRRRRDAFHWHGEFDHSRTAMLELIAATSDLQIVVVKSAGATTPPRTRPCQVHRVAPGTTPGARPTGARRRLREPHSRARQTRRGPHRRPPSIDAGPVASVEHVSAALEDDVVHRWVEHLELCQERLGAPGTGAFLTPWWHRATDHHSRPVPP